MGDLSYHRNLQELDLSHNVLEDIKGLSSLNYLRILKLSHNRIHHIAGLEGKKKPFLPARNRSKFKQEFLSLTKSLGLKGVKMSSKSPPSKGKSMS